MSKRVACVQSCYIPWKGYFDIIQKSDLFILYDCVQYTHRDWRNRNRIKTPHGLHWLTIPVQHDTKNQHIANIICPDDSWKQQHWQTLRHHYAKAPYFKEYSAAIHALYETCTSHQLSTINLHFLQGICNILQITTPIILLEKQIRDSGDKTDKLLTVCTHHHATHYISGPAAKEYLKTSQFETAQINIEWMDYSQYPTYPQPHPPFEHAVSILDLLFNTGNSWQHYLAS